METYFRSFLPNDLNQKTINTLYPDKIRKYTEIKNEIFRLMKEADEIAENIRNAIKVRNERLSLKTN